MKKVLQRLHRWFELNLGWYFVNGQKQNRYRDYLIKKYTKDSNEDRNSYRDYLIKKYTKDSNEDRNSYRDYLIKKYKKE